MNNKGLFSSIPRVKVGLPLPQRNPPSQAGFSPTLLTEKDSQLQSGEEGKKERKKRQWEKKAAGHGKRGTASREQMPGSVSFFPLETLLGIGEDGVDRQPESEGRWACHLFQAAELSS